MVVVVAIVHAVVIGAIAFRLYRAQILHRSFFWPALGLKLLAGVALGLIYTYYYSVADTFVYFHDAANAADLARRDLSSYLSFIVSDRSPDLVLMMTEPRARFFTKIASLFSLLTTDNYWAVGFYFSFLSFLGAWFLVQVIGRNIPAVSHAALLAFLFLPSVVFWTSGVLKESIAMAALFFLSGVFLKIWFYEKMQWWNLVLAVLCLWLLWSLKYYYAGAFLAVICTTLLYRLFFGQRYSFAAGREALLWMMLLILPLIVVTLLHPNLNIDRLLAVVVENNEAYSAVSSPEDLVHFHSLEATPGSVAMNTPWALVSGLFRPFLWEVSPAIQFVPALENTALLCLFFVAVTRAGACRRSPQRVLVLATGVYVVGLCVFLTLSAPNFGTLSRYRAGYICFFTFIILCNNPVLKYVERSLGRLACKKTDPNFDS